MTRKEFLLTCLIEECSEVIKASTKALRFGLNNKKCNGSATNMRELDHEIADVQAIVQLLEDDGFLERQDVDADIAAKKHKILCYMSKVEEAPEPSYGATLGQGSFI